MADDPPDNGSPDDPPKSPEYRNAKGQLNKGHQVGTETQFTSENNPKGLGKGARHKLSRLLDDLVANDIDAITKKTIALAKNGDMAAARLIFDKFVPHPSPRNLEPITVPSPATIDDVKQLLGELIVKSLGGELDHRTVKVNNELLKSLVVNLIGFDLEQMVTDFAARQALEHKTK